MKNPRVFLSRAKSRRGRAEMQASFVLPSMQGWMSARKYGEMVLRSMPKTACKMAKLKPATVLDFSVNRLVPSMRKAVFGLTYHDLFVPIGGRRFMISGEHLARIDGFRAPGISASPSEENMRYFNVMILGPSQSPYEDAQIGILALEDTNRHFCRYEDFAPRAIWAGLVAVVTVRNATVPTIFVDTRSEEGKSRCTSGRNSASSHTRVSSHMEWRTRKARTWSFEGGHAGWGGAPEGGLDRGGVAPGVAQSRARMGPCGGCRDQGRAARQTRSADAAPKLRGGCSAKIGGCSSKVALPWSCGYGRTGLSCCARITSWFYLLKLLSLIFVCNYTLGLFIPLMQDELHSMICK
ncbi:Ubiquitin-conjugating enzyme E2 36 [Platanthera guangdongensis]|uniref:Ubiquitin-conjugating enzyme E2 36 n=1 Tax=Platanthera guangdongensis TaxID=2320717 RepID=A0ABR2LZU4_9ASPA